MPPERKLTFFRLEFENALFNVVAYCNGGASDDLYLLFLLFVPGVLTKLTSLKKHRSVRK